MGGRLSGCKEPVKPFELIKGLGKGRSRMRADLGGSGGGWGTEAEAGAEVDVMGCGMIAGGRGGEAGEVCGCLKGRKGGD